MMRLPGFVPAAVVAGAFACPSLAGTVEQSGNLTGGLGKNTQPLVLAQFDTMGGTRQLDQARLELLTAVIGGGSSNGSGTPVHIYFELGADYSLGSELLASTTAIVDTTIPNNTQNSFTLFDNDMAEALIDDPVDLAPWIGPGTIELTVDTLFVIEETPPILGVSAGGTVQYTLVYEWSDAAPDADVNDDGIVNVDDLVAIIIAWGNCPHPPTPCPEDIDQNGAVNVDDLVAVIVNWG